MKEKLEQIRKEASALIDKASVMEELEEIRIKYLGRRGELTQLLRNLGGLEPSERSQAGRMANNLREHIESNLSQKLNLLREAKREVELGQGVDITLPGRNPQIGRMHPITRQLKEITDIFLKMGFILAEGPEIETEYYNFAALNTPSDHPVRDTQDSFYLGKKILLRTQTSPVQIRIMEKFKPPLKVISAGRCFRRDAADASFLICSNFSFIAYLYFFNS